MKQPPQAAQLFHQRAQERTGLLIPLYVYPANSSENPAFNRVIELKRRFETVPFWVIVNPASGPGAKTDPNYTRAIDRLIGAGCVTLGYVTTSYAKRSEADVRKYLDQWRALYPRVHGIFFDEMAYEDSESKAQYQAALSDYAHKSGYWPTVANPGADTPKRYFAASAADTIVVHEGDSWPTEARLKTYDDHPPFMRAVLLHSQLRLDPLAVQRTRLYAHWLYVTEGPYRAGDPAEANPWDRISRYLEELCKLLSELPK